MSTSESHTQQAAAQAAREPLASEQTSEERGSTWRELAMRAGLRAEQALDHVRHRFERRFRPDLPLHIVPYTGFANAERLQVSGRVLVYRDAPSSDPESTWGALQNAYRRFETDEVPDVRVTAENAQAELVETRTDEEGYFHFDLPTPSSTCALPASGAAAVAPAFGSEPGHLRIQLDLPDNPGEYASTHARVVIPEASARFGVISDVDDTILVTKATSIIKMMRLTLLGSSRSRMAFPGVAAFYRALHDQRNPFFYVSSSPWNLYEFLEDFMDIKGIVPGPLLLRDFGLDADKFIAGSHHDHKLNAASRVLEHYPDLPFLLIGDSGQDDPEIYAQLIKRYPGRILAVYIRDVTSAVRDQEVQALIDTAAAQDVDMLLVPDTQAAAVHAVSRGWLPEPALASISENVSDDRLPQPDTDTRS